ncbi:uncharacterized protein CBL_11123 [Carabus blaptoides fortunei]
MHSSGRGKKPPNVWNTNNSTTKANTSTKTNPTSSTETKFREAQVKLQAAVERYAKDYESSSSEDELESDNVIGSILKNYSQVGGKTEHLGRTQGFLEDALVSGAATCLICIGSIKRIEKIWSCTACYCFFHLQCIERWSKDSVTQQKESLREQQHVPTGINISWGCPKCRHAYTAEQIPRVYTCFCTKTLNPAFQPWLVPHSCGEVCAKPLQPSCGHDCVLLCHPGPCPPCPKTVHVTCYCGKKPARVQRCSNKEWGCGAPCKRVLSCGKHPCPKPCHAGACAPCKKRSMQRCACGEREQMRDCASARWQCEKVCLKPLTCGQHTCTQVCHTGACGQCARAEPRTCPCGKTQYELPCTEETPTCGDTCGKVLECGAHTCNQRCHKEKCGTCLELAVKRCRCGLHEKEVQCKKSYLCETKCKQVRDCNKHPCNRKCCDGNCPPCEKPCARTLPCGLHKCASICHRGPCYPCAQTTQVKCRCGGTTVTVPCGRRKRTRPPPCNRLCNLPPDCHHTQRTAHRCHFGDCPPCKQPCARKQPRCEHTCPAPCHSAVLVRVEAQKVRVFWEETGPRIERKALPCPECVVPMRVTCLGGHEMCEWPCYRAKPSSCERLCGRQLACGNHTCTYVCHRVQGTVGNEVMAGTNCQVCEKPCEFPRPLGCVHDCPEPCHTGTCPLCKQMIRMKCHCGLNQLYIRCAEWTAPEAGAELLQSCKNQCPKLYDCGHRCKAPCHSGPCPNADQCKKKVKLTCPCKRLRREFSCELVRTNTAQLPCDEQCNLKKAEEQRLQQQQTEAREREEALKNARELEQFQKKFQTKKRHRERKINQEVEQQSLLKTYWWIVAAIVVILVAVYVF